jgi:prepilin signal peptidase PulO-like enzyme (type II secretory pathway)
MIHFMMVMFVGLLGIVFGSFVNALVWRLHEQEDLLYTKSGDRRKGLSKSDKSRLRELSVLKGRSMCVDCGHTLSAKDLIPLLSWLSVRGKCRYCSHKISWQYPIVELFTGLMFGLSVAFWPHEFGGVIWTALFALWLLIIVMFVALSVYDLRWMLLPNKLVFVLQFTSLTFSLLLAFQLKYSGEALLTPVWGVIFLAGLFWAMYVASKQQWIGGGDVKLAVALGLIVGGPAKALAVLFLASLLGSVVGVPAMILGKNGRKTRIPFGPFLMIATIMVFWFGSQTIDWYMGKIGI